MPHAALIRVLQNAHAGELAAAYAYRGHAGSRRREPTIRVEIRRIEAAEWHHRRLVLSALTELGAQPRASREIAMWLIGRVFGLLCFVSFRFAPMYAAGRLEAMNVGQYEDARRHADKLGLTELARGLDAMVEEELRHEVFFADQCRGHAMLPFAARLGRWHPDDAKTRSE